MVPYYIYSSINPLGGIIIYPCLTDDKVGTYRGKKNFPKYIASNLNII